MTVLSYIVVALLSIGAGVIIGALLVASGWYNDALYGKVVRRDCTVVWRGNCQRPPLDVAEIRDMNGLADGDDIRVYALVLRTGQILICGSRSFTIPV